MDYNSCSKSSGSEGKRHDRFSRDYKNVLKRHDRFTLAPRPQQQPAGVTFDEATRIAFKKFRSVKKFPTGSRRSETAAQVELAVSEGGRLNEGALRKPMRATTKEWWAIHSTTWPVPAVLMRVCSLHLLQRRQPLLRLARRALYAEKVPQDDGRATVRRPLGSAGISLF